MNRDIILLPSLLLASGFECISTQDVKFLNNYRKHLDKTKFDLEDIFMVTSSDFELGGIMNPFNEMDETTSLYEKSKKSFSSFPYLSRLDIKNQIYQNPFDNIFGKIQNEIIADISILRTSENPQIVQSISENEFSIKNLETLKDFPFYQKIVALHLCGYGDVILDAFNNILDKLIAQEVLL